MSYPDCASDCSYDHQDNRDWQQDDPDCHIDMIMSVCPLNLLSLNTSHREHLDPLWTLAQRWPSIGLCKDKQQYSVLEKKAVTAACLCHIKTAAQTPATAHLKSKQLLLFAFALQCCASWAAEASSTCLACCGVLPEALDWWICFTPKIQHDGDWERSRPRGPKNVHNFLSNDSATSELSTRAWNWNVTDSKKTIFDLIIFRYFPIWQSKEMSHDLYAVNLWLKPVSATGASA